MGLTSRQGTAETAAATTDDPAARRQAILTGALALAPHAAAYGGEVGGVPVSEAVRQ